MNTTNPQTIIVLAKVFAQLAKEVREDLDSGETYEVDETIAVRALGSVKVGEDYFAKIVSKANPWRLLAVALNKLNTATIESIIKEAEDVTRGQETDLKSQVKDAINALKEPTITPCKGKVMVTAIKTVALP